MSESVNPGRPEGLVNRPSSSGILKQRAGPASGLVSRAPQRKLPPLVVGNQNEHKSNHLNQSKACPFCLEEQKDDEMVYEFTVSYILKMYQNFRPRNPASKMNQDFQGIMSPSNASDYQSSSAIPEPLLRFHPALNTDYKFQ